MITFYHLFTKGYTNFSTLYLRTHSLDYCPQVIWHQNCYIVVLKKKERQSSLFSILRNSKTT